jgi:hypothetical protein
MVGLTIFTTALSCLALFTGPSTAAAVFPSTFKFSGTATAPITCPQSNRTIYTAPNGNNFGILCNVDTNDASYQWGPFFGLSFKECLCKCDDRPNCLVATYTGTCYLKQSAFGQGFDQGAGDIDWTAVKIGTDYAG